MMLNVFEHFQNELSGNPNDPRIRKQYFDYKEKIRKLQLKETEEKILKDKVENLIKGNKPTKEFFSTLKRKSDFQYAKSGIRSPPNKLPKAAQGMYGNGLIINTHEIFILLILLC